MAEDSAREEGESTVEPVGSLADKEGQVGG
jgi:hypothetical protein